MGQDLKLFLSPSLAYLPGKKKRMGPILLPQKSTGKILIGFKWSRSRPRNFSYSSFSDKSLLQYLHSKCPVLSGEK